MNNVQNSLLDFAFITLEEFGYSAIKKTLFTHFLENVEELKANYVTFASQISITSDNSCKLT